MEESYFYSASDNGFYILGVHKTMPEDVVGVTTALYKAVRAELVLGKRLQADFAGQPTAVDPPLPTPEEEWETIKYLRGIEVARITVTTASGKVFDGDEDAQNRMVRAISIGDPAEVTQWKLADNTIADVTLTELKEALRLAGLAQTAVWMVEA